LGEKILLMQPPTFGGDYPMTILFTPSICPHMEPDPSKTRMVLARSCADERLGISERHRRKIAKKRMIGTHPNATNAQTVRSFGFWVKKL
ncbi:hypothetical protein, partial [Pseudooceanicola sp.]|uniref:hypothetical protein n=1 Tax=Pseudooceanicola sp. TaxID=1914328 RepID=UPI002613F531